MFFGVPFAVIAVIQKKIYSVAKQHATEIQAQQNAIVLGRAKEKNKKAAKEVAMVTFAFVFFFLPAWLATACRELLPSGVYPDELALLGDWFLSNGMACNPIIYSLRRVTFYEQLKWFIPKQNRALPHPVFINRFASKHSTGRARYSSQDETVLIEISSPR